MVYFLSDLHLGASYIADRHSHERRVASFLESIAADATEIYLLGDVLDYWYEYRTVVPRGYVRFFGQLARLSDAGVRITWLTGNHDIWLFDYLSSELGVEVIDAPYIQRVINGSRVVLAHGDRVGHRSWSFKFICRLFRNRLCQKLYSGIHPRWTVPFAHAWSRSSRDAGCAVDPVGQREYIINNVKSLAALTPAPDYIIMGHYHAAFECDINADTHLVMLGDWIDKDTFAVMDDAGRVSLQTFRPE